MNNRRHMPALLLKIETLSPSLSNAERQVVDYICANPEKVIYLSVADLAEKSGVSDATVVRACRSIGMSSYQELKVALAQSIVTPLKSIHEQIEENDDSSVIVRKVFQGTIDALNFTLETLRVESIVQAADAISTAQRVIVMGLGNSHAVAIDLQHKLMRLGIHATAFSDSHMQVIVATHVCPGDVVFAISHSGSSKDIVENTQIAKDNGATTISLTNIGISPLSKLTDIQLYTASRETQYRIVAMSSRIAQITIIDTIYTIIASRQPSAVDSFRRIEKALQGKKY